jgi:hypothetical protein
MGHSQQKFRASGKESRKGAFYGIIQFLVFKFPHYLGFHKECMQMQNHQVKWRSAIPTHSSMLPPD